MKSTVLPITDERSAEILRTAISLCKTTSVSFNIDTCQFPSVQTCDLSTPWGGSYMSSRLSVSLRWAISTVNNNGNGTDHTKTYYRMPSAQPDRIHLGCAQVDHTSVGEVAVEMTHVSLQHSIAAMWSPVGVNAATSCVALFDDDKSDTRLCGALVYLVGSGPSNTGVIHKQFSADAVVSGPRSALHSALSLPTCLNDYGRHSGRESELNGQTRDTLCYEQMRISIGARDFVEMVRTVAGGAESMIFGFNLSSGFTVRAESWFGHIDATRSCAVHVAGGDSKRVHSGNCCVLPGAAVCDSGNSGQNRASTDGFISCVRCDTTTADILCTLVEKAPDAIVCLFNRMLSIQSSCPNPQPPLNNADIGVSVNGNEAVQTGFVLCLSDHTALLLLPHSVGS